VGVRDTTCLIDGGVNAPCTHRGTYCCPYGPVRVFTRVLSDRLFILVVKPASTTRRVPNNVNSLGLLGSFKAPTQASFTVRAQGSLRPRRVALFAMTGTSAGMVGMVGVPGTV